LLLLKRETITLENIHDLSIPDITNHHFVNNVIEIWDSLDDDARTHLLHTIPELHFRFSNPENLKCMKDALSYWKRGQIISAFHKYLTVEKMSVAKLQLTAHWFYVDEFEAEIETAGFFDLFTLVFRLSN
jgi:hypothetical protein